MLHVSCPVCSTHCTLLSADEKLISCPSCGNIFDVSTARNVQTPGNDLATAPTQALGEETRDYAACEIPQLSRYEPIRLLGRGGFASVYLVEDKVLHRQVALKIPHERFANRVDILQEARIAASLRHPGIVAVIDVVQGSNDHWYVVSEFVDGTTLAQMIQSGQRLPITQVAKLMAKVARALHHAHRSGFVHRDVKPGNILISREGEPLISDFGLALHEDWEEQLRGNVAGTPCYMAPEQLKGQAHQLDGRTDEWAFGCVLYELLSGKRPFIGKGESLRENICERSPRPLRQRIDSLPQELEEICMRCLSKDVEDRYPTLLDVANALETWIESEAAQQHRTSLSAEPPKRRSRSAAMAAGTFAFLFLIAAAVAFSTRFRPGDYNVPVDQVATAGRWNELPLPRIRPREVAFTAHLNQGRWHFLTDTHSLLLDSREPGLVGLGKISSADYQLHVEMGKAQWEPGTDCGVFLGCQPAKLINGKDGFEFHWVGLATTQDGRAFINYERQWVWFVGSTHFVSAEQILGVPVEIHPFDDVLLDVQVMNGQVVGIKCQGKSLPGVTDIPIERRQTLLKCVGEFGVGNSRGSTRFHNCRILISKKGSHGEKEAWLFDDHH